MINKLVPSVRDAVAGIKDGAIVLCGGFGQVGEPIALLNALRDTGARDLVCVANNSGTGDDGLAGLINEGRVRKVICSFPRSTDRTSSRPPIRPTASSSRWCRRARISERMRCLRRGPRRLLLPVSAGTKLGEGKEDARDRWPAAVFEEPLKGDVALIKADQGRPLG